MLVRTLSCINNLYIALRDKHVLAFACMLVLHMFVPNMEATDVTVVPHRRSWLGSSHGHLLSLLFLYMGALLPLRIKRVLIF